MGRGEAGGDEGRAVGLGEAKDACGFFWVDRAAVKDAGPRWYAAPDLGVHCCNVLGRRGQPGPDRPDRLIGDDECVCSSVVGDRARELGRHDLDRLSGLALPLRLADAQNRYQTRSPRGGDLAANNSIRFTMALTTLGMPEDHVAAAEIGQHLGAVVARVSALLSGIAIF